ncbi:MAG: hypothetical protein U1E56_13755 [Bauldia sp.]
MDVGRRFQVMNPDEEITLGLDFANDVDADDDFEVGDGGEKIASVAGVTLKEYSVADPTESDTGTDVSGTKLSGSPAISPATQLKVSQKVIGLVAGKFYQLRIQAVTNRGNKPALSAIIPCRAPAGTGT